MAVSNSGSGGIQKPGLLPWSVGTNGATVAKRLEAQRFARELLESEEYRLSLKERIRDKKLNPLIECMLWDRAYGKVIEQVQVNVSQVQEDLSQLTTDELLDRATQLRAQLEEARQLEAAIPAEFSTTR